MNEVAGPLGCRDRRVLSSWKQGQGLGVRRQGGVMRVDGVPGWREGQCPWGAETGEWMLSRWTKPLNMALLVRLLGCHAAAIAHAQLNPLACLLTCLHVLAGHCGT